MAIFVLAPLDLQTIVATGKSHFALARATGNRGVVARVKAGRPRGDDGDVAHLVGGLLSIE